MYVFQSFDHRIKFHLCDDNSNGCLTIHYNYIYVCYLYKTGGNSLNIAIHNVPTVKTFKKSSKCLLARTLYFLYMILLQRASAFIQFLISQNIFEII